MRFGAPELVNIVGFWFKYIWRKVTDRDSTKVAPKR
jgi:hypothetical protein